MNVVEDNIKLNTTKALMSQIPIQNLTQAPVTKTLRLISER